MIAYIHSVFFVTRQAIAVLFDNYTVPLSSLFLSIYRYIVDTDMVDVSIQSGQSMTALIIVRIVFTDKLH